MSKAVEALSARIQTRFSDNVSVHTAFNEVTVEVPAEQLLSVAQALRDEEEFSFEELLDVCGVDLLTYGEAEWDTISASCTGFSRGVDQPHKVKTLPQDGHRFAVIYHLLSVNNNQRVRVKVMLDEAHLVVDSVVGLWASADWYEREAFDMFGVMFRGHPDLRRLLTDYGFIGHPFRKDFPLQGNVEMRYDSEKRRVVYEPVSIELRTLVPRVIRAQHPVKSVTESED